ncbi:MAG: outer membrane protein assembly factor BamB [Steroidobacteraceae bacterium]
MRYLQVSMCVAALLLAACSKDKSVDEPAKLTPLSATLRVSKVWTENVGKKKDAALRLSLGMSVADGRVFAAGHRGDVVALDLARGKVIWRVWIKKAPLSGGTAVGDGLVLIGTSDGRLFALDESTGKTRWSVRVNGEVLAPAAISEHLIALRTVDGKLHGLSPADGHELWAQQQQVPRLSLRGTARPVIAGDQVLSGFDNGKVLSFNVNDGAVQWEANITPPHGRTELERLDDIDTTVRVAGADVYTAGFQGKVAMLALDTGQVWWAHEASSYRSLTLDDDTLYMVAADGEVAAMRAKTGAELWRQKVLLNRGLSAPATMDDLNAIVVADFQGYVHWLDKSTGALAARASSGKVRVSATPIVEGDMALVINDRGQITAFRVRPIPGAKRPAAPYKVTTAPAPPDAAAAPAPAQPPQQSK